MKLERLEIAKEVPDEGPAKEKKESKIPCRKSLYKFPPYRALARLSWKDKFPYFPFTSVIGNGIEPCEEKDLLIRCTKRIKKKTGSVGWHLVTLEVCQKSIFRFNPRSKACRNCFHLGKGQEFPLEFTSVKKKVYLQESYALARIEEEEGGEIENPNQGDKPGTPDTPDSEE